ncbi:MAG: DUF2116 family Zn-ribbon domain-containing protein [Burkholderiales bacterium]|nr:DUF2116 family Zn-ribbon domain-containing protein [Burkholderiales bacterium]
MSDIADMSDKNVETFIASAIANACNKPLMKSTGHCRFCEEAVPPDLLFCNRDCRDDFEKFQSAGIRNGVAN